LPSGSVHSGRTVIDEAFRPVSHHLIITCIMYRHCIASFFLVLGSFSPVLADDVESKNSTDTGELRVKFEDAVRIGLQKSRTLELARMDRQMSSEKLMEATSPLLPQITSGFTYTRTLQPSVMFMPNFPGIESPMEISSDNSAKATLEVRQSLFQWLRLCLHSCCSYGRRNE